MAERLILALMAACTAAVVRVTAGGCGRPPTLENGSPTDAFISVTSFTSGTKITYRCYLGYAFEPGSSRFSTCTDVSTWTPLRATCKPKNCGNPGELLNGYYMAQDTTFGNKANFYCDQGYEIVGRTYRLCVADGWDGQVPTCDIVTCADPPPISNGRTPTQPHAGNWQYGAVARYSCIADFSLVGTEGLVCTATGQWDNKPPACKAIRCNRPETPENGRIVSGFGPIYKYRDSISYRCDDGFEIVGSSIIECGESSIFVPQAPTCRNVTDTTTTPVPIPTNTTIAPGGLAGTIVGQQYGLLIILNVTVLLTVSCCV